MAPKKSPRMDWLDAVLQAEPDLLHATDRALCVSLWSHMGSSGVCYPSQERVARVAGMSRRNAQTGLKRLEELGWIEREKANTERAQKKLREKAESSGRASNPDPRQHVYWARIPEESAPIESGIGEESAPISAGIGEGFAPIEGPIGEESAPKQAKDLRTEQYHRTRRTSADKSAQKSPRKSDTQSEHVNGTPATTEALGLVMGAWRQQAGTPSRAEQNKQGAVAKRLAKAHPAERIAAALTGIGHLFPYSSGQPWDVLDLERVFSKAAAKGERLSPLRSRPAVDEVDVIELAARRST